MTLVGSSFSLPVKTEIVLPSARCIVLVMETGIEIRRVASSPMESIARSAPRCGVAMNTTRFTLGFAVKSSESATTVPGFNRAIISSASALSARCQSSRVMVVDCI